MNRQNTDTASAHTEYGVRDTHSLKQQQTQKSYKQANLQILVNPVEEVMISGHLLGVRGGLSELVAYKTCRMCTIKSDDQPPLR